MSARYVAGIDAGQSSTRAIVIDDHGTVRGRGVAGPADHVDEKRGSTKCADACELALERALAAAHLPRSTRIGAVRIGLSGYDDAFDGLRPDLGADSMRMQHDSSIALAGAVTERPAVVVVAGTGSVAYGEDAGGLSVRVGGWGYLFGDEGSAFAVARDALAHAMRENDRGEITPLGDAALAFFERRTLRDLATAALIARLPRAKLAAFSRVVHDAARLGDAAAATIVGTAATALAGLATTALSRLELSGEPIPVAFSGGVFANDAFLTSVRARLAELAPQALPVTPRYDAATGAALLAYGDAELPVPERITEH